MLQNGNVASLRFVTLTKKTWPDLKKKILSKMRCNSENFIGLFCRYKERSGKILWVPPEHVYWLYLLYIITIKIRYCMMILCIKRQSPKQDMQYPFGTESVKACKGYFNYIKFIDFIEVFSKHISVRTVELTQWYILKIFLYVEKFLYNTKESL